jgi:HSP20 family protein
MLMRPYSGWMSRRREVERLRREMNRLFNEWPARGTWPTREAWGTGTNYPAMNVWTDEDSAVVTAELPGVNLEDIDISVEDSTLSLRGTCQREEVEGATYHRRERRQGSFLRTFQFPFRVDAGKVDATFKDGVLSIMLPRAEEDKPKKITVKAA